MSEPAKFVRGNTVRWTKQLVDKRPQDGWTLTYHLATPTQKFSVNATDNGDGQFAIEITATESKQYEPGVWAWQADAALLTDVFTVDSGTITVEQGLAMATSGHDARSFAQRMLSQIEDALLDSVGQETTISVDGMSFTFETKADLIVARDQFRREAKQEKIAERIGNGLGGNNVRVRF